LANVVSLFSGVGGFDLGLEKAGMKTIFQCEWDPSCISVLEKHWPNVPRWKNISDLTAEKILTHNKTPDIIAWGSPCQDLSNAGKKAGLSAERSGLFHEGVRIIKELRKETNNEYPRISIWENVAGALSSNKGADFGVILDEMAKAGALVQEWAVLDAQHFGVPQRRRRVFLVSIFDPATAARCPDPLLPVSKIMQGDSKKSPKKQNQTSSEIAACLRSGGSGGIPSSRGENLVVETVGALCHRDYKGVGSQYVQEGKVIVQKNDLKTTVRRLTPLECERLMGWPDDHTRWRSNGLEQSDSQRYKQCGNGIASPVAEWIGNKLSAIL